MRIKITSHNIDFANGFSKQNEDVDNDTATADVYLIQEGRDTVMSKLLGRGWSTNQRMSSPAKRGSAVSWLYSKFKKKRVGLRLGTDNKGVAMHPRWISWANLKHKESGKVIRFISVHFPPKRFRWLQPGMAVVLIALVKSTRVPVVVGGDFNYLVHNDPYKIARRTGTVIRGHGIDGFYVSKRLNPSKIHVGPKCNSDHHAVSIFIEV